MKVLVINAGSSSLKYKLFDMPQESLLIQGMIEAIGEPHGEIKTHHEGVEKLLSMHDLKGTDAVGHRVVHGGSEFHQPHILTDEVRMKIASLKRLAPLHNGANLEGIEAFKNLFPHVVQVVVFDTAFHQSLSKAAYTYAFPLALCEKEGIRRYGFHGISYAYITHEVAKLMQKPPMCLRLIALHLGNGASACAIDGGKSIDTSMGFTPLEGLVMGTRCGDIDPAIVLYLQEKLGFSQSEASRLLNHHSGLFGICGTNDMREIEANAQRGDENAKLAIAIYVRRIKKYIGAYVALLGGVDAIIFTGGIGEHSAHIRAEILFGLSCLGIKLDPLKNSAHQKEITHEDASVRLFVIPTDEELEIARATCTILK